MRFAIIIQSLVLACLSDIGPAIATPGVQMRIVHTTDLDLTRRHARTILRDRIAAAIGEVCGPEPRTEDGDKNGVFVCRAKAFQSADRQLARIAARGAPAEAIAMMVGR